MWCNLAAWSRGDYVVQAIRLHGHEVAMWCKQFGCMVTRCLCGAIDLAACPKGGYVVQSACMVDDEVNCMPVCAALIRVLAQSTWCRGHEHV